MDEKDVVNEIVTAAEMLVAGYDEDVETYDQLGIKPPTEKEYFADQKDEYALRFKYFLNQVANVRKDGFMPRSNDELMELRNELQMVVREFAGTEVYDSKAEMAVTSLTLAVNGARSMYEWSNGNAGDLMRTVNKFGLRANIEDAADEDYVIQVAGPLFQITQRVHVAVRDGDFKKAEREIKALQNHASEMSKMEVGSGLDGLSRRVDKYVSDGVLKMRQAVNRLGEVLKNLDQFAKELKEATK